MEKRLYVQVDKTDYDRTLKTHTHTIEIQHPTLRANVCIPLLWDLVGVERRQCVGMRKPKIKPFFQWALKTKTCEDWRSSSQSQHLVIISFRTGQMGTGWTFTTWPLQLYLLPLPNRSPAPKLHRQNLFESPEQCSKPLSYSMKYWLADKDSQLDDCNPQYGSIIPFLINQQGWFQQPLLTWHTRKNILQGQAC